MIPIAKPIIGVEERKSVLDVLASGLLAQGEKVREFEMEFAKYIGTKYAVATSSGTTALHLALLACGIKKGDEVLTTPFTFIATANAVIFCNATPVFVDINEKTFNIDTEKIEKAITKRTKAIIPVHLYGQPCEMDRIMEIADKHNLIVIEDACQAHGAEYKGTKVGSFGTANCFSFYPTKNMTTGEGGMITTDSEEIAEKIRQLRDQGQSERYNYSMLGYNFRMTDIAAAVGIEQLKKLNNFNCKRIENARILSVHLKNVVEIPYVLPHVKHVFHQYTIKTRYRNLLKEALANACIGTGIYYPKPLHYYRHLSKFSNSNLKNAEIIANECLSLPVHPGIGKKELEKIITVVLRTAKDFSPSTTIS